jgi:hypothetical protein
MSMYGSYNSYMLRRSNRYLKGVKANHNQPAAPAPAVPVRPKDEEFVEFENLLNTKGRLWAVEEYMNGQDGFDRPAVARWLYNKLYDWGVTPGFTYWFCSEYARWKNKKLTGA